MAGGPWAELIKQGFQNFRHGMTQLTNGYGNIAQAAGNGKQQFTPMGGGNNQPLQSNAGIFVQGLQRPDNMSAIGNEAHNQITGQGRQNNYGIFGNAADDDINGQSGGNFGIFGNAANNQIGGGSILFDELLKGR